MNDDPIVAEVRRFREEHSKEFGYDLDAICEDFASKHTFYANRLREAKKANKEASRDRESARAPSLPVS